ncbi:DUF6233 domain-containing protein [Streptomyces sp. NPDC127079]|uniref:DUF6233 domain-containing protein n=1 Tax=Streptomyces sp. NPDC127079 TaxID=3347132 RepID=UPI00364E663D
MGRGAAGRPPTPQWTLELVLAAGQPLAVHVGDCGMAGRRTRPVGQDHARRLLTTDTVPACPLCRPDTELHIVDLGTVRRILAWQRPVVPPSGWSRERCT